MEGQEKIEEAKQKVKESDEKWRSHTKGEGVKQKVERSDKNMRVQTKSGGARQKVKGARHKVEGSN